MEQCAARRSVGDSDERLARDIGRRRGANSLALVVSLLLVGATIASAIPADDQYATRTHQFPLKDSPPGAGSLSSLEEHVVHYCAVPYWVTGMGRWAWVNAVGRNGAFVYTEDAGRSWTTGSTGTTEDLHDVRICLPKASSISVYLD
jgi:hypothetical protein